VVRAVRLEIDLNGRPSAPPCDVSPSASAGRVRARRTEFSTPWFDLVAKQIENEPAPFYSLAMPDYVSVVAITDNDDLVLVTQFRPAVERTTLELPSGHVDNRETPESAARRELLEETGFEASAVELLGVLNPDTGRLGNKMWCFLAENVKRLPNARPEEGIGLRLVPRHQIQELLTDGELDHALNIAALSLAATRHRRLLADP